MYLRLLPKLLTLSLFLALLSCGGDETVESDNQNGIEKNEWTDSIFGNLSDKEQYYQHLIIEFPNTYQSSLDSLVDWIGTNQPGAIKLNGWHLDTIALLKSSLDTLDIIQPIFYGNYYELLNLPAYPYWEASANNESFNFLKVFQKMNFSLLDFEYSLNLNKATIQWLDSMKMNLGLSPIVAHFDDSNVKEEFNLFLNTIQRTKHNVYVDVSKFDSVDFHGFRSSSHYSGLFVVNGGTKRLNGLLQGGADLLFSSIESGDTYSTWTGPNNTEEFNNSTKRILDIKSKVKKSKKAVHLESDIKYSRLNLAHGAVSLISNQGKMLPFKSKFTIYSSTQLRISQKVRKENRVGYQKIEMTEIKIKKTVEQSGSKVIILSDTLDDASLKYLNSLGADSKTLVCFTNLSHYNKVKNSASLMYLPIYEEFDANIFVQQLTARINLKAHFVSDSLIDGIQISASQLARTTPEYTGLDADTLARINWAVKNAMNGRAFPGCQVLLAKNGCIIYDKTFGHHSYQRQKVVNSESVYDLASLTKVVATTMVGMKLYEMGAYKLKDSLEAYLPDSLKDHLRYPSTIRNITFEELFIHKSGMPAGFPVIRYMQYKTEQIGMYDKYFCDVADTSFNIEVAENFYLEKEYGDSMWLKLNQIWLDKNKPYKYSDVNMNTLYMMFKSIIQSKPRDFGFTETAKKLKEKDLFVEFLYNTYYKPLGMERTRYKPLKHFNRNSIVPTEDESWWRKQLLQGHVHDPNAALMGGIGGNAGMFSTTNNLAILCQMLLNKGIYNNQRFLQAETVTKFTSAQENSSRGLGFNKRTISTTGYGMADSSSTLTYGHTGFTGTCFWIDPDSDLVYIFLSNRVHPKVNNRIYNYGIRKKIHNTAYEARLNY